MTGGERSHQMISVQLLCRNCWVTARTTAWSPEARIGSAMGALVKAIHLCDWKGWNQASRPLLRADYHWGSIPFWRSLPWGVFHCMPESLSMGEHSSVCFFTFLQDILSNCNTTILFPSVTLGVVTAAFNSLQIANLYKISQDKPRGGGDVVLKL